MAGPGSVLYLALSAEYGEAIIKQMGGTLIMGGLSFSSFPFYRIGTRRL